MSRYLSALLLLAVCAASVSAAQVALSISTTSLSFQAVAGGQAPASQTVSLSPIAKGAVKWTVQESTSWLSVSTTRGTNAGSFAVVVNHAGLTPGTYQGVVTVTSNRGDSIPVSVTLAISTPATPTPEPEPTPEPTPEPVPGGHVIDVPAGGNLQAALDAATGGTTIRLAAGATYRGPFVLRPNAGDFITITSSSGVPAEGTRITLTAAGTLARIQSTTSEPAIRTSTGANRYRLVGLEFGENAGAYSEVIRLGDATDPNPANIPRDIVIDRVLMIVDPLVGQKRGILANADNVTIQNSDIRGVWGAYGEDSQAICQWQANGNLVIRNNRLEAGSEVILIGGAFPAVTGLNASGILIEGNHLTRPLEWMGVSKYKVKNLLELKAGTNVTIRGNLLENHWAAAQPGPAIVFTPKHGMRIMDVRFEHNVIRSTGTGFNVLGYDYEHPYDRTRGPQLERVTIQNNLFILDPSRWGGTGRFMLIGEGADNFIVSQNTVVFEGTKTPSAAFYGYGALGVRGWSITNNIVFHGSYGIFSDSSSIGTNTLQLWFNDPVFSANVLYGATASWYPSGNAYPSWTTLAPEFEDVPGHYYRLRSASVFTGLGVDFSLLPGGGR